MRKTLYLLLLSTTAFILNACAMYDYGYRRPGKTDAQKRSEARTLSREMRRSHGETIGYEAGRHVETPTDFITPTTPTQTPTIEHHHH